MVHWQTQWKPLNVITLRQTSQKPNDKNKQIIHHFIDGYLALGKFDHINHTITVSVITFNGCRRFVCTGLLYEATFCILLQCH